jgi:putative ABC transport system permease protein
MKTALFALLSHWRRHPVQLATLMVGLSLATALWSAVQTINSEARASYARAAATLGQDRLSTLLRKDGSRFDQKIYVALRRAGWLVSPVLEGDKRFGEHRLRVFGVDPLTAPPQAQVVNIAETGALLKLITPPGMFYVAPETATKLAGQTTPPLRALDGIPPGVIVTDMGLAQVLLDAPGQISRLLLWPEQPQHRMVLSAIAPDFIERAPDETGDLARLTDSFHLNLTAFGFLAFAVGLFIVHSAVGLAFEQRRPMFRTLRALGVPARSLMIVICAELLTFAVLAGMAGVALGYAIAAMLLPDVAATLRGLYGASVPGAIVVRPETWALGMAIAVLGTLISSAQGLFGVWRLPLLASAQPRAWAQASRQTIIWQLMAAAALLVMAALIARYGSGLMAGFALLAALLLGAALALPAVLMAGLSAGGALSKSAIAQWFWADARQQLPGLSLALTAMLLALAANIGVGTMVSSFRQTFVGWIEQRLASELYISTRDDTEAAAVRTWLASRSDAVLPIWNVEGEVAGLRTAIFGIADHATYREKWPMLNAAPNVWQIVASGDGALINEQLSRRKALNVGDTFTLTGGHQMRIAGVYSDYGNPNAQVIIGVDTLTELFPDVSRLRYAIRVAPEKVQDLAADLRSTFGIPEQNIIDQAAAKELSLQTFERTFKVTGALNVLTLAVAALAMFASLLTLAGMRLPQVAPVWAMGVTRQRLAAMELCRSFVLAVLTAIAALPLGLGLAWILLAIVNVEAFGWRLPMYYFPVEWLRLALLSILATALAAALPAWKLSRLAPSELLKVFANER